MTTRTQVDREARVALARILRLPVDAVYDHERCHGSSFAAVTAWRSEQVEAVELQAADPDSPVVEVDRPDPHTIVLGWR